MDAVVDALQVQVGAGLNLGVVVQGGVVFLLHGLGDELRHLPGVDVDALGALDHPDAVLADAEIGFQQRPPDLAGGVVRRGIDVESGRELFQIF